MRISVRFVLSIGVTLFVITAVGLVGGLSIWGGIESTLEVTRALQRQETARITEKVQNFAEQVEADVATLAEVLGENTNNLENQAVIRTLKPFVRNKSYLNGLTLVRKNRTNVWVGKWGGGQPVAELNIELDEESWRYAIRGRPGDGTEGFEDVYMEPTDRRPVITYTKHLSDCCGKPIGTVYLDLDLTTLSSELAASERRNNQQIFVFDTSGAVIAHPSLTNKDAYKVWSRLPRVSDLKDPVATAVQSEIVRTGLNFLDIQVGDQAWLTSVARIDDVGDKVWYAVSVVPRDVVLGPMINRTILISVIGLVILAVAIIIALVIGRAIAAPVSRLALAADAVRTLNIDLPTDQVSRFSELNSAERAFHAMLTGLEVFIRYVPKNLVKRLIQLEAKGRGVEAEEREVTILFTDIAGYTSISDGMNPKDLAGLLNDYFEVLVGPVTARGGTVDKFIGDALMAFWNAPDEQEDHADLALGAALEIQKVIQEFNDARVAAGQKPLVTRIGVHTGRVLVGNIGASERMNYTIVGDAVNTTARLEGLGKEIGQTLCISSNTRNVAQSQYSWREVHRVTLRGRSQETLVYTIQQES
ncbi:MAG TPA: adenylate/guanylate cyclase domain-containing protein [Gammaproteobacteria bacterium]|nr:adenylate/guanylate cyclase domain-containing protein [Gammaproteobacteria bacterium]